MSPAKTAAERKADERQRHKEAGRTAVTVHVRPEYVPEVRALLVGTAGCSPFLKSLMEAEESCLRAALTQAPEVALYRFLGDVVSLQRLCGRVEALATPEENAAWLAEIEAALSNR